MAAKNSPDGFWGAPALSSNIRGRLLSAISIGGNFLNYSQFKLAVDLNLSSSTRSVNNIAVEKERTRH
jgi:hypothetical protein